MNLEISDCSEDLALIDRYRTYHQVTSQVIAWGVNAIAKEDPIAPLNEGWGKLTDDQRWNRIRASLSAPAIRALANRLSKEFRPPPPTYRPDSLIIPIKMTHLSLLNGRK